MKLGIVIVKETKHVVAAFSSRGQDPKPTVLTTVGTLGLPLRDRKLGNVTVIVPAAALDTVAVNEPSSDRARAVLANPWFFRWDDSAGQLHELIDPQGLIYVMPGSPATLTIDAGLSGLAYPATYLVFYQDLPVGTNAATSIPSGQAAGPSGGIFLPSIATGIKTVTFVTGALPVIQ